MEVLAVAATLRVLGRFAIAWVDGGVGRDGAGCLPRA
jgi:hypothetical protein